MRFGISLIPHVNVDRLGQVAQEAERLGFDDIWIPDHYFFRDAYSFLTLVADRTERVRLGPAVASPFLRHPALLASVTATLGEASGGRAILGIGPGGFEFKSNLGTPIQKPLTATREAVEIARRLWAGGLVDYEGEVFSLKRAQLPFVGSFTAPVYMAARGPRMLELAGSLTEGVITHGISRGHLDFVRERVGSGSTTAVVIMLDCLIDDDLARARDRLRPACIVMAGGNYSDDLIEVYGLDREQVRHLREAVNSGDWAEAERRVTDDMVDAFCFAGPAERCRTELKRLAEAGVDEVIISTNAFADLDTMRTEIERIADVFDIGGARLGIGATARTA